MNELSMYGLEMTRLYEKKNCRRLNLTLNKYTDLHSD